MLPRLLLSFALFTVLVATALPARADADSKLDRWFEVSKMAKVMRGYPEALSEGLEAGGGLDANLSGEDVKKLAEKHFAAAVLTRDLRRVMSGTVTEAVLDHDIAFLESDLGRRTTDLAVIASDPAMTGKIEREGARIYDELVRTNSPRVDLIRRGLEDNGLIEWGVAAGMNLGYAMLTAMFGDQLTEDEILSMLNSSIGAMRDDLIRTMNADFAYTYRSLTDAELERYVAQYETAEGRQLLDAFMDAFRIVLVERSRAFGYDVRKIMGQRRG